MHSLQFEAAAHGVPPTLWERRMMKCKKMMSCALWISLALGHTLTRQGDTLDRIVREFSVNNVPIREALDKLSKVSPFRYWMEPDLDGRVTLDSKNQKFELVLQLLLGQTNITYRYEHGRILFIPRPRNSGDPGFTEFVRIRPTGYSSRYVFTNSRLYMTPKRTILGTVELFKEAAYKNGFYDFQFWAYGKEGFAMLLPFEQIDSKGNPSPKDSPEQFSMQYLEKMGFENLVKLYATHYRAEDGDYRAILLTVDTEPLKEAIESHTKIRDGYTDGILDLSYRSWSKTPEVSAIVYEFRRKPGQLVGDLVKEGESKISAKQHLILSGLWTEQELDGNSGI